MDYAIKATISDYLLATNQRVICVNIPGYSGNYCWTGLIQVNNLHIQPSVLKQNHFRMFLWSRLNKSPDNNLPWHNPNPRTWWQESLRCSCKALCEGRISYLGGEVSKKIQTSLKWKMLRLFRRNKDGSSYEHQNGAKYTFIKRCASNSRGLFHRNQCRYKKLTVSSF